MAGYEFLTTWVLDGPRDRVWEAIWESERWPEWWRGVERVVELEPGDENGVGQLAEYVWRSKLPYELSFEMRTTRVEPPYLLEGQASGELAGTGRWRLYEQGGTTAVVYEWNVSTTRPWMNAVAPLLRPAFAWNHDWVMGHGGRGLARSLGSRLLASS